MYVILLHGFQDINSKHIKMIFFCISLSSYSKNTKFDTFTVALTVTSKTMIEFKEEGKVII